MVRPFVGIAINSLLIFIDSNILLIRIYLSFDATKDSCSIDSQALRRIASNIIDL